MSKLEEDQRYLNWYLGYSRMKLPQYVHECEDECEPPQLNSEILYPEQQQAGNNDLDT